MYLIWNRLKYVLSPQFDIYNMLKGMVRDKVADIGFGTGFGAHLLNVNAKEVYGFDVDENAIQFAKTVFPFNNIHFDYGDIVSGIHHSDFDYVLMIDVIEHIQDVASALKNVKRMMAKDGQFICSTPNRLSRYRKGESHVVEYSPPELKALLKSVFSSVTLKNYNFESPSSEYDSPIIAVCRNGD